MRILVTNDDGINAPGLNVLVDHLKKDDHDIVVVAPDVERSASSHSITLRTPIRVSEVAPLRYAVSGTPVDCVIVAIEMINKSFDLVVSGINRGPNLGEDILYSGTIAAAIEAMYYGLPALAVSSTARVDNRYDTAAHFTCELIRERVTDILSQNEVLSINVPSLPVEQIKGVKITKPGKRVYKDFIHKQIDPWGRTFYWIGGENPKWVEEIDQSDSDFSAIAAGFISATPLSPNFINLESCDKYKQWSSRMFPSNLSSHSKK